MIVLTQDASDIDFPSVIFIEQRDVQNVGYDETRLGEQHCCLAVDDREVHVQQWVVLFLEPILHEFFAASCGEQFIVETNWITDTGCIDNQIFL